MAPQEVTIGDDSVSNLKLECARQFLFEDLFADPSVCYFWVSPWQYVSFANRKPLCLL